MEKRKMMMEIRRMFVGMVKIMGKKRLAAAFTLALAIALLSSCGKKEEEHTFGIDGYVYVPEEVEIPGIKMGWVSKPILHGGILYFKAGSNVMSLPMGEEDSGSREPVIAAGPSGTAGQSSIKDYCLDGEGNLYCLTETFAYSFSGPYATGASVSCRQAEGGQKYSTPVPDSIPLNYYNSILEADGQGRLYLLTEENFRAYSAEGELLASLPLEDYRKGYEGKEGLLSGADGKVYYCVEKGVPGYSDYRLLEAAWDGTLSLEEAARVTAECDIYLYGSPFGVLCTDYDGFLYQYSPDLSSREAVLCWSDSSLPMDMEGVSQFSGEGLLALRYMGTDVRLYRLERKACGELPEKEMLTLAAAYPSSYELSRLVADFNLQSSDCHVTLKMYREDEVETRLNASLVSKNPPDLLEMMTLDILTYAEGGALEDLSPYLEGSGWKKEDYLESVVKGFTIGGKLVCLPRSFSVHTLAGERELFGEGAGYTAGKLMELTGEYPERRLRDARNLESLLRTYFDDYIIEEYIDWEKGECRFDSEEFRQMLEWLGENCRGTYYKDNWEEYLDRGYGYRPPEELLLTLYAVSDFWSLIPSERYGLTLAGYPTADGRPRHEGSTGLLFGMVSSSRHKEGAWSFLEYYLGSWDGLDFPTRKEDLQGKIEDAMTPEYELRLDGEVLTSEDGKPVERWKTRVKVNGNWVDAYALGQEEVDKVLEILDHVEFDLEGGRKKGVLDIILEEMAGYLSGEKSLDEVQDIIQNRASLLVSEGA